MPQDRGIHAASLKLGINAALRCPALAIGRFEADRTLRGTIRVLDERLDGALSRRLRLGGFSGKLGEVSCMYPDRKGAPARVYLYGLGKRSAISLERIRRGAAAVVNEARNHGVASLSIDLFSEGRIRASERAQALVEGAILAAYAFTRYRSKSDPPRPSPPRLGLVATGSQSGLDRAVRRARVLASTTNYTRDLANTPASEMTPAALAAAARRLARGRSLRCTVLTRPQIARAGMRALLAVGQGSRSEPRFIRLDYTPSRDPVGTVVLVGKGITFDTGGISLKPANRMWDMKFDKCGATAVLGAVRAAADLELPVRVVALAPAAENMPSGTAYRPGDIVRTAAGKTVEIRSTDAEGRLILADALHYATRLEPDAIVDIATLTGSCAVALGREAAGLFGNDDSLQSRLVRAGESTGERVWRLPLWDDYGSMIDSHVADVKNVGGRRAGAITAAAFLQKFVGKTPWAHLDIAGTAHTDGARGYHSTGATGFGARLLARFLEIWIESRT